MVLAQMQAEFQDAIGTGSEQGENIVQRPAVQQSHFDIITIRSSGAPSGNGQKCTAFILGSSSIIGNRTLQSLPVQLPLHYLRLLLRQHHSFL